MINKGMVLNKKIDIYKISISIIFGLLGFFLNFHNIIFPFGEYTAAILFGLLFPILITLSWGWKYGLLSALAGGCQSMWWIWGPSNGYAILLVVPPFTLWVVWHGIFTELRRKQESENWWLSMYVVEIPFRILSSINLLTLSRWAITLNPPSWSWASNAPNIIPMHFSVFVTIKQAAVGFIVLLFADVVLNNNHVRRFFKLKEYIDNRKTGYIISAFLLLGCLFWLLDSVFYVFAFHKASSFINVLAFNIPNYNIFSRAVFFISCLICGLITSRILRRQKEGEIALKESNRNFQQLVSSITTVVWKADVGSNGAFENTYTSPIGDELLALPAGTLQNDWNKYFSYIKPEYLEQVNDTFREAIKLPGNPIDCEYEVLKDNGQTVWFHSKGRCFEKNGKLHVFGSTTDITKRKKVEEALKESEKQLQTLIDAMPDFICFKDGDGRWIKVNNSCIRIFQFDGIDYRGKNDYELSELNSKLRGSFLTCKETDARVWKEGCPIHGEETIPDSDGSDHVFNVVKVPVYYPGGGREGLVVLGHDITERERTEKELDKYREHLEELEKK